MKNFVILIYVVLLLVSISAMAKNPSNDEIVLIVKLSREAGLNPNKLIRIAYVESKFKHKSLRINTNDTIDVGMFQINSIHFDTTCKDYNVFSFKGNLQCAIKLLSIHKNKSSTDSCWFARYHSRTKKLKENYCNKINSITEKDITYVYND